MNWTVRIAKDAVKQLDRLPADRRLLVQRGLRELAVNPFAGDVKPLQGKRWRGRFRKRGGRYRIIFSVSPAERLVEVSAILVRDEKTYR